MHLIYIHPYTSTPPPSLPPQWCRCSNIWYQIRRTLVRRPNLSVVRARIAFEGTICMFFNTHACDRVIRNFQNLREIWRWVKREIAQEFYSTTNFLLTELYSMRTEPAYQTTKIDLLAFCDFRWFERKIWTIVLSWNGSGCWVEVLKNNLRCIN